MIEIVENTYHIKIFIITKLNDICVVNVTNFN